MLFSHDHNFYQCKARTETAKLLGLANIYASSSLQAELKKDSDPQKAMHGVIIWPSNSTPRNITKYKPTQKPCSYTNIHGNSIHNSHKEETTEISTGKWIDE